jgi:hypothetical protein
LENGVIELQVDEDMNVRQRLPRIENAKHLAFIRQLPCLVCGDNTATEAAHIRFGHALAWKRDVGKSEKPDDCWTLPLCGAHHREQHEGNERNFWMTHEIDPIFVALALWRVTGDVESGEAIIRENSP